MRGFLPIGQRSPSASTSYDTTFLLKVIAGQHTTGLACDMVANRDAIRQTAAGDALALGAAAALDLGLPLGDLGDLGDFDLEVLRLFFLLLRSLPFESCEVDLAGVALLGLPGFPSCLNLQSFPLLHLPCFQNLQTLLLSPRPEGDLPRLGSRLLSLPFRVGFGGGTSCLNLQLSSEQPPLFHLMQYPFGI